MNLALGPRAPVREGKVLSVCLGRGAGREPGDAYRPPSRVGRELPCHRWWACSATPKLLTARLEAHQARLGSREVEVRSEVDHLTGQVAEAGRQEEKLSRPVPGGAA